MRDTYFFLWLYVFLLAFGIIFLAIPAIFVVLGLAFGALGFYFDLSIFLADVFMRIGLTPWDYWFITFPLIIIVSIGFVLFTHKARKTKTYRKVRVSKK